MDFTEFEVFELIIWNMERGEVFTAEELMKPKWIKLSDGTRRSAGKRLKQHIKNIKSSQVSQIGYDSHNHALYKKY